MNAKNHSDSSGSGGDTSTSPAGKRPSRWKWFALIVAVVAAVTAAVGFLGGRASISSTSEGDGLTAVVTRGSMVVSITGADSQVDAAKRKVIRNELSWPAIIERIVPDGTQVAAGDEIIAFECTQLEDAIEQEELALENAKLTHKQAVENLKLKRKEMDNKVRKAEQAVQDAKDDLAKYLDKGGEWEIKKDKAESDIALARGKLALAKGKLDFKLKVNADPDLNSPYSDSEVEADRLNVESLEKALKEAISNRDMLIKYDHPREVRKFKEAVNDTGLELLRANLVASTEIGLAEAEVSTKNTLLNKRSDKLKELKEDKEKRLTVRATERGLVVYNTGSWYSRRSQNVTVEVGEEISPRQQLMIIPDMTTLEIRTKVLEAVVNKLEPGKTRAIISLDARSDLGKIGGTVKWRAPQADQQHPWRSTGVKVYSAIIDFDDKLIDGLRPGMSAQVEMILEELPDVLSVPIAAVFGEQEKTYCWRVTDGAGPQRVEVVVGGTNDRQAEITRGLSESDRVMLVAGEPVKAKQKEKPKDTAPEPRRKARQKAPPPKKGPDTSGKRPRPSGRPGKGTRGP